MVDEVTTDFSVNAAVGDSCNFPGDSRLFIGASSKDDFFSFSGESFAGVDFLLGGCNSSVQKIMLKKVNIEV